MPADKQRWGLEPALQVAVALRDALLGSVERIEIVGSLRRRKPLVGDVELIYIPRIEPRPNPASLFGEPVETNIADDTLAGLLAAGALAKRLNAAGRAAYGQHNKLLVHTATGIPVDLFAASRENWHNYLVCRTGGAESNVAVASAAQRKGWKWHPYGPGFTGPAGEVHRVQSEREVFEFVGLPYLEPHLRR